MNGMDGGTCLKPSFEPIIMARKPFKGSCIDNVIEWGVGGINIDECRVGTETTITKVNGKVGNNGIYGKYDKSFERENPIGRFPANTILTYDETDFDEVCGGFPVTKSTGGFGEKSKINAFSNIYGDGLRKGKGGAHLGGLGDSGSASRYFMNCKHTGKDEEIWKQLFVNNVVSNLEIGNINKEFIAQNNVEDLLLKLKNHYAKYVENQQNLEEIFIVQDIVEILTWDSKIETSQVIQDFIGNYNKCIQFLNLVQFVEKMDSIDTTQTTQNLLKLFGYVKVVITNYIQGNLKFEQKRYLYAPKASKRDRDEGLEEFEEKQIRVLNATNPELENKDDVSKRFITIKKNIHPTVKPTELMQYLVRLVTPKNGIILDPFNGSGSTGKAVMYENKDRNKNYKYIGIELSEEYLEISKARINFAFEQIEEKKEEEDNQLSLWKTK